MTHQNTLRLCSSGWNGLGWNGMRAKWNEKLYLDKIEWMENEMKNYIKNLCRKKKLWNNTE